MKRCGPSIPLLKALIGGSLLVLTTRQPYNAANFRIHMSSRIFCSNTFSCMASNIYNSWAYTVVELKESCGASCGRKDHNYEKYPGRRKAS